MMKYMVLILAFALSLCKSETSIGQTPKDNGLYKQSIIEEQDTVSESQEIVIIDDVVFKIVALDKDENILDDEQDIVIIDDVVFRLDNTRKVEKRQTSSQAQLVYQVKNNVRTPVKVYPNPVQDHLYYRTQGGMLSSYQLMNQWGQIVLKGEVNKRTEGSIDCSHLPSGTYYLKSWNEHGKAITMTKIVKI